MSAEMLGHLDSFYINKSGLHVPYYRRRPGEKEVSFAYSEGLHPVDWVDDRDVLEKVKEIAMNRRVLEYGEDSFDISTVTDQDPHKPFMIHMSTYGSSLDNAGNAWEFAVQCLQYPDYNHVYVASFANGASSPIPERDGQRDWVVRTGRLTIDDGDGNVKPIGIMQNLYRGLAVENINMIRVMGADSAGVSASRALSLAMPPDQLDSAVFSGATGMRHMSLPGIGVAMAREMIVNARQNRKYGKLYDPAGMSDEKAAKARAVMEQYTDPDMAKKIDAYRSGRLQVVRSRIVSGQSLRRGESEVSDPVVQETDAMTARHKKAALWYILAERDPLYGGPKAAHEHAQRVAGRIATSSADVGFLVPPEMSHAFHTHFPQVKAAVARVALSISGRRR